VLGEKLNVSTQGLEEDIHVPPQRVEFVFGRERGDRDSQILFGRELRDPQLFFGCQSWQNLLDPVKTSIDIFEMRRDHHVVHRPNLLEKPAVCGRPF
jgi:hypothetical protein